MTSAALPHAAARLVTLLLGAERKMRRRIIHLFATALVYALCVMVNGYAHRIGMATSWSTLYLQIYISIGLVLFYVMLRSGFSLRFKDPSLALMQSLYAIGAILLAYLTVGAARGTVLMLLPLVIVFGMLSLKAWETILLGFGSVILLGAVMLIMSRLAPERFDPRLEGISFSLASTILLTLSWVAKQIAELRARLRSQKLELTEALLRVQELAIRDELTQLFNRRHMQALLDEQHKRYARTGGDFCVALIDIDHFKRVNDNYGHKVGDEVLRKFAEQSLLTLRQTDVIGRWGGEEFMLLLLDTDAPNAVAVLERLRRQLEDLVLVPEVPQLKVRFSAGLARHCASDTMDTFVERADHALYDAKSSGRNRTVLHGHVEGVEGVEVESLRRAAVGTPPMLPDSSTGV